MSETLGDALPREMTRVRNLIPMYEGLEHNAGQFAIAMMNADLDRAQKAMIEGDLAGMIRCLKSLREYKE